MHAITIGLDIAKHWFQVHGVNATGEVVVRRKLRRAEVVEFFRKQQPCVVGIEACATAHHWARELIALGHEVKLMPPPYVKAYVKRNEAQLARWDRRSEISKLLSTVPGVGIMGATAIAATVSDASLFRSGREFAAWLGMTPRQNSSGGNERLGRTSKRGDKYIRCLLVAGAVAVLRHARERATKDGQWVRDML